MNEEMHKKLQWKGDGPVVAVDLPPEQESLVMDLTDVSRTYPEDLKGLWLIFCQTLAQVEALAARLAGKTETALVWAAYPKQSSKKYKCGFNRDTGWASLEAAGWRPVRQVALDDDWSALRFRPK